MREYSLDINLSPWSATNGTPDLEYDENLTRILRINQQALQVNTAENEQARVKQCYTV